MINDNDYSLLVTCGKAANGRMVVRMKEFAKCAIWAILKNDSFGYQCYSINWMSTGGTPIVIVLTMKWANDFHFVAHWPWCIPNSQGAENCRAVVTATTTGRFFRLAGWWPSTHGPWRTQKGLKIEQLGRRRCARRINEEISQEN